MSKFTWIALLIYLLGSQPLSFADDCTDYDFLSSQYAQSRYWLVSAMLTVFLDDPEVGIESFTCRVRWNPNHIERLKWNEAATVNNDGNVTFRFPAPVYPTDGCIAVNLAYGHTTTPDSARVTLLAEPVFSSTDGRQFSIDRCDPSDDRPTPCYGDPPGPVMDLEITVPTNDSVR